MIGFRAWMESDMADFDTYDLQARYDHYNALLFDGELPRVPIRWANIKAGGEVRIKIRGRRPDPRMVRAGVVGRHHGMEAVEGSHEMLISRLFKRSERGLDAIMLHEMIHVYFNHMGRFGYGHGPDFVAMARRLSERVGFEVPLTDTIEHGISDGVKTKEVGVQVVYKKDGRVNFAMTTVKNLVAGLPGLLTRWRYLMDPKMMGNYAVRTEFYTVSSRRWTEFGIRYGLQRRDPKNMGYYRLDDEGALEELRSEGRLLAALPDSRTKPIDTPREDVPPVSDGG